MFLHISLIILSNVLLTMSTKTATENNTNVELTFRLGNIRGSILKTRLGKDIYSFRSIRFAEPPVGDLRFKPAVPIKPWNETYDATQECPMCPQPGPSYWIKDMNEDCLRLNIYTTKLPKPGSPVARPVLVFFHPGAFIWFSSESRMWGPQYLLDEVVVLVTVNYRLGALGWISTGDEHAPGNLGLKDQVEALRFVRKHIAAFGGDPNSVTISGYSAGGRSVSLHLVSPMSKGLFHRAIAMSGNGIYHIPLPYNQKDLAVKQARFLGCSSSSSEEIIKCLKTKSAKEITESHSKFAEWRSAPMLVWQPVVEPEIPGVERFLPAQPAQLIKDEKFLRVPLMVGANKDEFGAFIIKPVEEARQGNNSYIDDLNANWTRIAPIWFNYERDTPRSLNISNEFRRFYFNDKPISLDNIDGLRKMHTDGVNFKVNRLAKLIGQYSDKPVYYYHFTYQGRFSFYTWSDKKPFGVDHHDELIYLFYISTKFPFFDANAPETPMVEKMTAMWANFVINGHPIPGDREAFANVTWLPFTPQNKAYLQIDETLEMKRALLEDRMNKWEKLFPIEDHCQKLDSKC